MRLTTLTWNTLLLASLSVTGLVALAEGARPSAIPFSEGFATFPVVLKSQFQSFSITNGEASSKSAIESLCEQVKKSYSVYRWDPKRDGCGSTVAWQAHLKSHDGSALLWSEFGSGENTTLVLGGVHPDEITPIPMVFRFANHLATNPHLVGSESRVIVAPLVNPDGFFRKVAKRTNLHGVDLNRNFFTKDWYASAKPWWAEKRKRDARHFPGHIPNSEIETLFQIWLIDTYKPDKIISVHAPLGFYDYDGPGERKSSSLTSSEQKAKKLVHAMSASSHNYKVVDYSFYPGSLGNYAGNERGIPTITLELETTNPAKVDAYWAQFSPGLEQAIRYPFSSVEPPRVKGTSMFLDMYSKHAKIAKGEGPKEL